jgi:hypothetical protein
MEHRSEESSGVTGSTCWHLLGAATRSRSTRHEGGDLAFYLARCENSVSRPSFAGAAAQGVRMQVKRPATVGVAWLVASIEVEPELLGDSLSRPPQEREARVSVLFARPHR